MDVPEPVSLALIWISGNVPAMKLSDMSELYAGPTRSAPSD